MALPHLEETVVTDIFRKRLAKIWGVAPFRVEVSTDHPEGQLIRVDGRDPTPEQMAVYQKEIASFNSQARNRMS